MPPEFYRRINSALPYRLREFFAENLARDLFVFARRESYIAFRKLQSRHRGGRRAVKEEPLRRVSAIWLCGNGLSGGTGNSVLAFIRRTIINRISSPFLASVSPRFLSASQSRQALIRNRFNHILTVPADAAVITMYTSEESTVTKGKHDMHYAE